MKTVDLRSDTVTRPSREMREAMAAATVGDDCLGEDPTVRELEELSAQIVGKEAALFVVSGTLANLLALLSLADRASRVVVPTRSHIQIAESGGGAAVAGIVFDPVVAPSGVPDPNEFTSLVDAPSQALLPCSLLTLENTHNAEGGKVLPTASVSHLCRIAHDHNVRVHLDGSRIFNASVALEETPAHLCADVDSVSFCLSKGLGAPVGSVLAGSSDAIEKARQHRLMLGGGWRQAGIVAAAGIVALTSMVTRLAEDHRRARMLAEVLEREFRGGVSPAVVETNIVNLDTSELAVGPADLVDRFNALGIRTLNVFQDTVRFVTHVDVNDEDVEWFGEACRQIASAVDTNEAPDFKATLPFPPKLHNGPEG